MAKDDFLQNALAQLASSSGGKFTFRVTTAAKLGAELGIQLARTTNPIYVFSIEPKNAAHINFIAFTLSLDGAKRPATRAEALGRSLAVNNGELFNFNPLLLVYDYVGNRLLGIAAADLFGAFAERVERVPLGYSDSSSFSLSPNFQNGTISMYVEMRSPQVWACSTADGQITANEIVALLEQVAFNTSSRRAEVPSIVSAINARLAAVAERENSEPTGTIDVSTLISEDHIDTDEKVQIDDRIWAMLKRALEVTPAIILVGPPGTGKSALVRKVTKVLDSQWQAQGREALRAPLWATPDESWTSRDLIGGETVVGGELVFRPGWVLRSIAEGKWLVLDEANRGDLDRIFGALLTWLSGGHVTVGVESTSNDAKHVELGWTEGASRVDVIEGSDGVPGTRKYLAGDDWRLVGTYNAVDSQRVFRVGAALGRRFARVPVPPITPTLFSQVLLEREPLLSSVLSHKLSALYTAHYEDSSTRLGPAQFLGMTGYLKSAISASLEATVTKLERSDNTATTTVSDDTPPSVVEIADQTYDAAICEAYVLNVGVQLAQLERPDLDQLCMRLQARVGLSISDVSWLREMLEALS